MTLFDNSVAFQLPPRVRLGLREHLGASLADESGWPNMFFIFSKVACRVGMPASDGPFDQLFIRIEK